MLRKQEYRRSVGRPRSAKAHNAILAATIELLAEAGFEGMTIEAVSNRAEVGKPTIYRRWSSKEDLVLDALKALSTDVSVVDTGDFRQDVVAFLRDTFRASAHIENQIQTKLLSRLIGEIYERPALFSALYGQLYEPYLRQLQHLIKHAQARGELYDDLEDTFIICLVGGPLLLYALLSTTVPTKYTLDELTELTVDAVLCGIERDLS
jgi:AcrR family transcriptional regulator